MATGSATPAADVRSKIWTTESFSDLIASLMMQSTRGARPGDWCAASIVLIVSASTATMVRCAVQSRKRGLVRRVDAAPYGRA